MNRRFELFSTELWLQSPELFFFAFRCFWKMFRKGRQSGVNSRQPQTMRGCAWTWFLVSNSHSLTSNNSATLLLPFWQLSRRLTELYLFDLFSLYFEKIFETKKKSRKIKLRFEGKEQRLNARFASRNFPREFFAFLLNLYRATKFRRHIFEWSLRFRERDDDFSSSRSHLMHMKREM